MAKDEERLWITLEARLKDLEKGMKKGDKIVSSSVQKMQKDASSATRRMERDFASSTSRINQALATTSTKIGALGKAMGAGLIGGAAAMFSLEQLKQAVASLAQVAADAKMAGVSNQIFQEMVYVAGQSRISIDAVTDGLKELQLRADEFAVTGKGSAAEAFQRLGMTAEEVQERLRNPADLLQTILTRVYDLNQAARTRILDELMGGQAGEQFLRILSHGRNGLEKLRREAHDVGVVMSDEVLAEAEKIDREFRRIGDYLAGNFKANVVSIASLLRQIWDMGTGETPLEDAGARVIEITREMVMWEGQLKDAREIAANTGLEVDRARVQLIEDRITALKREEEQLKQMGWAAVDETLPKPPIPRPKPTIEETPEQKRARQQAAREAERQAEAIARTTEALRFEIEQMSRNELQQRIATELRNAGADAASKEGREITELVTQLYQLELADEAAKEAQKQLNETMDELKGTASGALSSFLTDLKNGEGAAQALSRVLDRLLDQLIQMASQSAISKLFGAVGGAGTLSGGGLGALVPGGLYHSGGVVGLGGRSRGVPSSVFAGAPRMHSGGVAGLRPDEVPAILQRGETVLPKGANTRAPEMRVIINNAPPHQREERQNETGGTDLLINFLKGEVAKDMASPKTVIGRSLQSMGGWPLMNKR